MNFKILIIIILNFYCFYVQASQEPKARDDADTVLWRIEFDHNYKDFKKALELKNYDTAADIVSEVNDPCMFGLLLGELREHRKRSLSNNDIEQVEKLRNLIDEERELQNERLTDADCRSVL